MFAASPFLISLDRADPEGLTTGASNISFTAIFSEAVNGVDVGDFVLATTGNAAGTIAQVTPVSGSVYKITVDGILGDGTLGLDLVYNDTIRDVLNNRLSSVGSTVAYQADRTVAVGTGPYSVVAADFNGDGKLDLATADNFASTVSVVLGNGDGTFQAQQTYAVALGPFSIVAGDLTGDGKVDLAVASNNSNNISVLVGNGNGTFQSPTTFAVGALPRTMTIGDIDGDGKLDLASANSGGNNISVLFGNGNGTFLPQQTFAVGTSPRSVALDDFDGDGKIDLLTSNASTNNVSVLLGNGDRTFKAQQTFAVGTNPYSAIAGDVNRDGKADVVVANRSGASVSVLLGNGDGTFQAQRTFAVGAGARMVRLTDADGDGIVDLVTANLNANSSVSILVGNGDGTFQAQRTFAVGSNPHAVLSADLNGDGNLDIVTADRDGPALVSVLLGAPTFVGQTYTIDRAGPKASSIVRTMPTGPETYWNTVMYTVTFNEAVTGVDSGDFFVTTTGTVIGQVGSVLRMSDTVYQVYVGAIGDGTIRLNLASNATVVDLLANPLSTEEMTVGFDLPRTVLTGSFPQAIAAGDFNGDGKLDLIVANDFSNDRGVLLGNGDGTFQARQTFPTGSDATAFVVADLNGDGKLDLAWAGPTSGIGIRLGNGDGTFKSMAGYAAGTSPRSLTVGDFNGDGKLDLAVAGSASNNVSLLRGNGDGTFLTQVTFAVGADPRAIAAGDVDGDGKLDLVVVNEDVDTASVLLGNGNGTFKPQQTYAVGDVPRGVTLSDVNADGKLDVLVANQTGDTVSVLLGNGNGTFQGQLTFAAGDAPTAIQAADLNSDGRIDIVVADTNGNNLGVLVGNGNGTFQALRSFAVGTAPAALVLGDFNNDSRLDAVTADRSSLSLSVMLNASGFGGEVYTIDQTQGALRSIVRNDSQFTQASTLSWTVTFGETVTGVDAADFALTFTGTLAAAGAITVTPVSGSVYTVTVNVNAGNGTATLKLVDNGSIHENVGNGLSAIELPQSTDVGAGPIGMALGDVNGDGRADLVTANYSSTSLSIALGNGDGTFQAPRTIAAAVAPRRIYLSDVNGDGKLDVLYSHSSANAISIMLGNGDSTFQARRTIGTSGLVNDVFTIGDLNGDGKLDLAYSPAGNVAFRLGNGDGTFQAESQLSGQTAFSIDLVDVNNDGKLDLITNPILGPRIFLGNGNGTFQAPLSSSFLSGIRSLTSGDFNQDGKIDLAITIDLANAGGTRDFAAVLLGNGDGTFKAPQSYYVGYDPLSILAADFNQDGYLDFVTADSADDVLSMFYGDGNGGFRPRQTIVAGDSPRSLVYGDVNGDGAKDLLFANNLSQTVGVMLSRSGVTFTGQAYTVDHTKPLVSSIVAAIPAGTTISAASLDYTVTLNEDATGVDAADFRVTTSSGIGYTSVVFAATSARVYRVTISGIVGSGDIRLDLVNDGTIKDLAGNVLNVAGEYHGASYTIDHTPPTIVSIERGSPNGLAASVSYLVTFSETVAGVDAADFSLDLSGVTVGAPLSVSSTNGSVYTVTVSGIVGSGTMTLKFVDNGSVSDLLGNRLSPFRVERTVAVSDGPTSVAFGDFNGDGKLDLVAVAAAGDRIDMLLGNGDATYQAAQSYAVVDPIAATTGDFNGDGKLDLAVVTQNGTLTTLFGGVGGFTGRLDAAGATSADPIGVFARDVNADGKVDLTVVGSTIGILLGNGDGTFKAPATFAPGSSYAYALGDVTNDNRLDLVLINEISSTAQIMRGFDPFGFFAEGTLDVGSGRHTLVVGNVNGDTRNDVIAADSLGNVISVLLANGSSTFAARKTFAAGPAPMSPLVGDVNGDGRADIVVANSTGSSVSILLGNGNGTFQSALTLEVGVDPRFVTLRDLDGDGRLDLVAANSGDDSLSILRGLAGNAFVGATYQIDAPPTVVSINRTSPGESANGTSVQFTVTFNENVTGVDVADFVLAATGAVVGSVSQVTPTSGSVYVVTVSGIVGSGTLGLNLRDDGSIRDSAGTRLTLPEANFAVQSQVAISVGLQPDNVVTADLNNDGKLDLIIALRDTPNPDILGVMLGNGDGTFQAPTTYGSIAHWLATADVNADGKLDIIHSSGVFLGNGDGTLQAERTFSPGTGATSISVADLDGDGKLDLVLVNQLADFNGSVSILKGNGDGTFQARSSFAVGPTGSSPFFLKTADVNVDGRVDLIITNLRDASLDVLLGNGDGTFQPQQTIAVSSFPYSVDVGDFNGDGRADLVVANGTAPSIGVLLGNGDGTFQAQQTFSAEARVEYLRAADFDGDGKLDVAFSRDNSDTVSVALGNGDGTFRAPQSIVVGDAPHGVAVGDFNGDGKIDLATPNTGNAARSISIVLNSSFGTFTGQKYDTNLGAPKIVSIAQDMPAVTSASTVSYTVTFSEAVTGVDLTDFRLTALLNYSSTPPSLALTALSSTTYRVMISGIEAEGTIMLNLIDDGTIRNSLGGRLDVANFGAGFDTIPLAPQFPGNGIGEAGLFADFNGDGTVDYIDVSSGVASLWLNFFGNFVPAAPPPFTDVLWLKGADFNADGKTDLFVNANAGMSVFLGNGDGTFQATPFAHDGGGSLLTAYDTSDFNNDGKLDLVLGTFGIPSAEVLLGNGDGTFREPLQTIAEAANVVASGDLNGDGKLDLVVGGGDTLAILLGNGDGTFAAATHRTIAYGIFKLALGDHNGDGKLDLIGATGPINYYGNAFGFLGNGDGTFGAALPVSPYLALSDLKFTDLDGDGRADWLFSTVTGGIGFFPGTPGGLGELVVGDVIDDTVELVPIDFNGDGRLDVIARQLPFGGQGSASVLINRPQFAAAMYTIDRSAPVVTGVYARGVGAGNANWNASFLASLEAVGLGTAALGYRLSSGAGQLNTLPWGNVNTISIVFQEGVTISQNDLMVVGSAGGPAIPAITSFSYDSASHIATWTFAAGLPRGKFLLHLGSSVTDLAGNVLDGEWTVSSSTISGNQSAGGDFNFRFNVLPGDFNASNGVTITEILQARNDAGKGTASAGYDQRKDTDGSGGITITEILQARNRAATSITGLDEPVAPGSTPQTPFELAPLVPGDEEGDFVSLYAPLTNDELAPIVAEAIRRWEASGLVPHGFDWSKLRFSINDLGPQYLGLGNPDGSILLDEDGASWGWFIDGTPTDDAEFTAATSNEQAATHMDLLTVVMHEIGHALGYPTGSAQDTPAAGLMSEALTLGTRRTPGRGSLEPGPSDLPAHESQAAPMLGFMRLADFDYAPLALEQLIGTTVFPAPGAMPANGANPVATTPIDTTTNAGFGEYLTVETEALANESVAARCNVGRAAKLKPLDVAGSAN